MLHQVQTWRAMLKKDHMYNQVYNHACNFCLSAVINIQSSFTAKNPRVRFVEIGHMTTLCVSTPQSFSAVSKNDTPYSKMAANKLFFCLHVN